MEDKRSKEEKKANPNYKPTESEHYQLNNNLKIC